MMEITPRRQNLKDALVAAAERTIATSGLRALRARALADEVGCAVGAIYNVFQDLDDIVLAVNSHTLAAFESSAAAAYRVADEEPGAEVDRAVARLVRLALNYLDFAVTNTQRWRALFDHHMPEGREVPDWYLTEQRRLFHYVEEPLGALVPNVSPRRRALLARSLFSAVHGIVVLGLEAKLEILPLGVLREQVTYFVTTACRGMVAK